jgi:hypothetical protein
VNILARFLTGVHLQDRTTVRKDRESLERPDDLEHQGVERSQAKVGGQDVVTPISLRATMIMAREDGEHPIRSANQAVPLRHESSRSAFH